MCPFSGLPDHWKQIFLRNLWTKRGEYYKVIDTISAEKREILSKLIQLVS
jgi:hypothetical protein